jgi:hypothetical protein
MTAKRKEETCEAQLRRMCKNIADDITNPKEIPDIDNEPRTETASSWMEGVYDIRYIVDHEKKYLGAMLMVAGNGPTIWVNTWTKEVEGSWWGDKCTHHFHEIIIGLDSSPKQKGSSFKPQASSPKIQA